MRKILMSKPFMQNNQKTLVKDTMLVLTIILASISGIVIFQIGNSTNHLEDNNIVFISENDATINTAFNQFKEQIGESLGYSVIYDLNQLGKESTLIIFGHGTSEGIYIDKKVMKWEILANLLLSYESLENVVLSACYGQFTFFQSFHNL